MSTAINSFEKCRQTELKGLAELIPFANYYKVQLIPTEGQFYFQKSLGDAIRIKHGQYKTVEYKIEEKWTGRLYVEEWSNLCTTNSALSTPGWLRTCGSDYIWYYFRDKKLLYTTKPNRLKKLVEENNFTMLKQTKHKQKNEAWGYVIPVEYFKRFDLNASNHNDVFWQGSLHT